MKYSPHPDMKMAEKNIVFRQGDVVSRTVCAFCGLEISETIITPCCESARKCRERSTARKMAEGAAHGSEAGKASLTDNALEIGAGSANSNPAGGRYHGGTNVPESIVVQCAFRDEDRHGCPWFEAMRQGKTAFEKLCAKHELVLCWPAQFKTDIGDSDGEGAEVDDFDAHPGAASRCHVSSRAHPETDAILPEHPCHVEHAKCCPKYGNAKCDGFLHQYFHGVKVAEMHLGGK
jgi:hypothetical protein